jgi:hypothetical protein
MKPAELSQPSQIESAIKHLDSFAAFFRLMSNFPFSFENAPDHFGRNDFLPVEPQGGLSFLFRLGEPRFA